MGRSGGALHRERMALQAEQVHLAHTQVARIGRTVGSVATATALCLHRHVLVNKRSLFFGMALDTNRVPTGQGPRLAEGGRAVDVVAVTALDEAFVYPVVIRLREVGLRGCMTSVAETGLCSDEEVFLLLGVVW
jgi:hypothetical protein